MIINKSHIILKYTIYALVFVIIIFLLKQSIKDKTLNNYFEKLKPEDVNLVNNQPEVVISNLEIPWELVFLPDGRMILTERPGKVLLLSPEKKKFKIKEVAHIGEGGLLGIDLDPDFSKNNFIYLYFTYREGNKVLNKVQRFKFTEDSLSADKVIVEAIAGSSNHDGGRIKFGPDGELYITTGDAENPNSAQDLNSLSGKILRLNPDGSVPSDNPFPGSLVYSYGHRNPQGLAWDESGQLWATEHGPSSLIWPNCCQDEVNRIDKGGNYGWPNSVGDKVQPETIGPVVNSGREIWAPSGSVISEGKLYFGALRGQALFAFDLKTRDLKKYFAGEFGRIRTITIGPNGDFYLLTSNLDGRGNPISSDDRLVKFSADLLK